MCNPRKIFLLFVVVLCLASRGFAATALGSITITGAEQSSGSTWDTGTVTATINGVSVSYAYGQFTTPASVASALGALISCNCNMPVYAQAAGTILTLYQRGSKTITSASITSVSNNPSLFPNNSFLINGGASWSPPQIVSLSLPEGPPGMGFVISGTGFGDVQGTVKIGAIAATIVSWSDVSVVVRVPTGASTGQVVVTPNVILFPSLGGLSFQVDPPFLCN
jgi:hypothetical protein